MPGNHLPILTIDNKLYFRDDGMYVDGLTDGTLNIVSDTTIRLSGNTTIPTGKTFTVTDGAVNLGTGDLTLGGNATLATGKYLLFTAGSESLRFPNDGVVASGQWARNAAAHTRMWDTPVSSSCVTGWINVKIQSGSTWMSMQIPCFSGGKV
jgi:hypothetical protein